MGPPFDRHPTTPAQIRNAAAGLSRSEGQLDGVMNAFAGPAQAAADAVDGELDGQITVPAGSVVESALESKAGARLCRGAVNAFADCVELFDTGVDDINERWEHARTNDFFVGDDVDDRESEIDDARSAEAAALRAEYRVLEATLDTDAESLAQILRALPVIGLEELKNFQAGVDARSANEGRPEYVALGDSYSAGTGAGDYKPYAGDTNPYRSENSYAELLADRLELDLDHRAVNGATTDGIADQLHTLGPDTEYVTLTAGGNNVGFSKAVRNSLLGDGKASIEESRQQIEDELPEDLDALYTEIRERAPNATIVVGTYPHLVDGERGGLLSDAEESDMNDAADELAAKITEAAEEAGFEVADVRERFEGHESDDSGEYHYEGPVLVQDEPRDPWIHGLAINPFNDPVYVESFHPNEDGHEAYANEFEELLR